MINDLKTRANKYLKQFPAERIAEFDCPHCHETQRTLKPESEGEEWDTLSTCVDCEELFFKVVNFNGIVRATFRNLHT